MNWRKPSSNFTDPLPEHSPVPLTIFTKGTRFSSSISSQTLPNSLLALTKKLNKESKCVEEMGSDLLSRYNV